MNTVHRLSQPHAAPSAFVLAPPQFPAHPKVTTSVGADVLGPTDGGLLIGPAVGVLVVGTSLVSPLGTPVGNTDGVPLLGATVEPSSKQIGVPVRSCGAQWSPAQHGTMRQLSPAVFRHPVMSDGELVGRDDDGASEGTAEGITVGAMVEGDPVGPAVGILVDGATVGAAEGVLVAGAVVGVLVAGADVGVEVGTALGFAVGVLSPLHSQL